MKTNNLIAQKLAEFDSLFEWTDFSGDIGAHVLIKKKDRYGIEETERNELKSFLKSFAKDILQSVGEEVEGMKKHIEPDDGTVYHHAEKYKYELGYNQTLSDLRVRLKEMEKM